MEQGTKPSLKISGVGSATGGVYGNVEINGAGSVNGDLDCQYFSINGTSEVKGNVKAVNAKSNGASKINGSLSSESLEVNGALRIKGDVDIKEVKVSGTLEVDGAIHSNAVDVRGALKTKDDCETENFKSAGGFTIGGLLSADQINIDIIGPCRAREIGGEKIEAKRSTNIAAQFQRFIKDIFNTREFLTVETIEGDDIYIEATSAKMVRGNNVKIGPDCVIDTVEYKNNIDISGGARVREQRKI